MSLVETSQSFSRHSPAAAPAKTKSDIGFMVAAFKGMLRDTGTCDVRRPCARKPATVTALEGETELLDALALYRTPDQVMSLLVVGTRHMFGFNTNSYVARRQILMEALRENLRSSDRIFELANGRLVLALGDAKLLTGIMVGERIGIALETRQVHKAPISVSIGVACVDLETGLSQALTKAKAAMTRAEQGDLSPAEVTSLKFTMS
jgi:hypothetical protein